MTSLPLISQPGPQALGADLSSFKHKALITREWHQAWELLAVTGSY
jgi:hypothetical protein